MSEYAYIRTIPDSIKFSLPYSDNSGERLVISLSDKKNDVLIKDGNDACLIPVEDIEWVRQALDDIKSIIKMSEEETKPTNK